MCYNCNIEPDGIVISTRDIITHSNWKNVIRSVSQNDVQNTVFASISRNQSSLKAIGYYIAQHRGGRCTS